MTQTTTNHSTEEESSNFKTITQRRKKLYQSNRAREKIAADILKTIEILCDQNRPDTVAAASEIAAKEIQEAVKQ